MCILFGEIALVTEAALMGGGERGHNWGELGGGSSMEKVSISTKACLQPAPPATHTGGRELSDGVKAYQDPAH